MVKTIEIKDFEALENPELIDVREVEEFEEGHVKGSVNMPLSNFEETVDSLDKNKKYYIICRSGQRSHAAAKLMSDQGYDATNVLGGVLEYSKDLI